MNQFQSQNLQITGEVTCSCHAKKHQDCRCQYRVSSQQRWMFVSFFVMSLYLLSSIYMIWVRATSRFKCFHQWEYILQRQSGFKELDKEVTNKILVKTTILCKENCLYKTLRVSRYLSALLFIFSSLRMTLRGQNIQYYKK